MISFLDQIARLRTLFDRAQNGTLAPTDREEIPAPEPARPLDERLFELNMALLANTCETLKNNHRQISLCFEFAKLVSFHGRDVRPDTPFWQTEIDDDLQLMKLAFIRSQSAIEDIVASSAVSDSAKEALAAEHKIRMDEFDRTNLRRVRGEPLFQGSDRPDIEHARPIEEIKRVREAQFRAALEDVQRSVDYAKLSLGRFRLVREEVVPAFDGDPAQQSWEADLAATSAKGRSSLDVAEYVLRNHAARHSCFSSRLDNKAPAP